MSAFFIFPALSSAEMHPQMKMEYEYRYPSSTGVSVDPQSLGTPLFYGAGEQYETLKDYYQRDLERRLPAIRKQAKDASDKIYNPKKAALLQAEEEYIAQVQKDFENQLKIQKYLKQEERAVDCEFGSKAQQKKCLEDLFESQIGEALETIEESFSTNYPEVSEGLAEEIVSWKGKSTSDRKKIFKLIDQFDDFEFAGL